MAKEVFNIKGKLYICVAGVGNGTGHGWSQLSLCECIPKSLFTGKAVSYNEKRMLVFEGKRERGYRDQYFSWDGKMYVIISESISAYPIPEPKQIQLF